MAEGFGDIYAGDLTTDEFGFVSNPLNINDYNYYFEIAAKKDASKQLGGKTYFYDIYENLFGPTDIEIDNEISKIELPGGSGSREERKNRYIVENAPNFFFDVNSQVTPNNDFNSYIAANLLAGNIKDEKDLVRYVTDALNAPSTITLAGQSLRPQEAEKYLGYAKSLWFEYKDAEKDFKKKEDEAMAQYEDIFASRGLPDRRLRYDPRTVKGYTEWENKTIDTWAQRIPANIREEASKRARLVLRTKAADIYAEQGYSPFYDAVLRARAGS